MDGIRFLLLRLSDCSCRTPLGDQIYLWLPGFRLFVGVMKSSKGSVLLHESVTLLFENSIVRMLPFARLSGSGLVVYAAYTEGPVYVFASPCEPAHIGWVARHRCLGKS